MILDIINPIHETLKKIRKAKLDLTPKRIQRNLKNKNKKIFNPDITARGDPMNEIRIFGPTKNKKERTKKVFPKLPAYRVNLEPGKRTMVRLTIIKKHKNLKNEETRVGINMKGKTNQKFEFKTKSIDKNRISKAEAYAIIWILDYTGNNELKIETTSKKLMNWLTTKITNEEENLWINTENEELWIQVLEIMR